MADSSVDEFFAKKDKSKKSKSRKFATGANVIGIGKVSDEGGKMMAEKKREKEKVVSFSSGSASIQSPEQDDDEWKDVEEKETDYSGLKIQNVQISDLRDEDLERSKLEELQDDDQSRNKDGLGPWNRGGVVEQPAVEQSPAKVEESQTLDKAPPKKETKYIPPAMREGATPSSTTQSKTKAKMAPQLASEFDFPTLSAASEVKPPKKVETSDLSKGRSSSQQADTSNICHMRPYAELARNQAESS